MVALEERSAFQATVRRQLSDLLVSHGETGAHLAPLLLSPTAKFFRSELVRLSAHPSQISKRALIDWAMSAELIHAASLIHDDIVDESALRRDEPTLHMRKGNGWAVLAGDLLLSEALKVIERYGPAAIRAATSAVSSLTSAAMSEIDARPPNHGREPQLSRLSLEATRRIAVGKTGALFGYCLSAGPILNEDFDMAVRFTQAGLHLGTAYQFRDDLIDLIGEEGKPRASDLREGNPNAFLALARELEGIPASVLSEIALRNWDRAADQILKLPARVPLLNRIQSEVAQATTLLGSLAQEPQLTLLLETLRKDPQYV